jgi:O-methyltransferase
MSNEVIHLTKRVMRFAADEGHLRGIARKYRHWTMIPARPYVSNLRLAAGVKDVPGAVVECGTWRGGMIAGIADVLGPTRRYYLFDSFEGLPPAQEVDGKDAIKWQANTSSPDYRNNCSASEQEARDAMSRSAARDVRIVKGWFNTTLPQMDSSEKIALLRMDADWYDSTKCILDNLADRVVPGGLIVVDDYYSWEGCTRAVNEYAAARNWRIRQSKYAGVCFIEL